MKPHERKTLTDLASGGEAVSCPYCGCMDFRTVRTWVVQSGERHSSFRCRFCEKYEFNASVERVIRRL